VTCDRSVDRRADGACFALRDPHTGIELIDLHIHSRASDGEFTSEQIERVARARGLRLVAIADHDEGRESADLARRAPDIAVAAIELTCRGLGGYADLLGIGLPDPSVLAPYWRFERINALRLELWVELLQSMDWDLPELDVDGETRASWIVSQRVFASAANRRRAASMGLATEADFRAGMLTKGAPGHVGGEIVATATPVEQGIAAIRDAGGVPVLAHPGLGPVDDPDFDVRLPELIEAGLEGLEAIHPAHDAATEARIAQAASRAGLLISVGSDTHDGDTRIGRVTSRSGLDMRSILDRWLARLA
jgi:3',5'-nucleoside bisphosphate phosphatase